MKTTSKTNKKQKNEDNLNKKSKIKKKKNEDNLNEKSKMKDELKK